MQPQNIPGQPPVAPAPGAPAPDAAGAAPAGAPDQVDPKFVEAYRRVLIAASKIIYNPQVKDQLVGIVKKLQHNPIRGVVVASLLVLDHLRQQVKGINPDFVYMTAPIVGAQVLELANAAGLVPGDKATVMQVTQGIQAELQKRVAGGGQAPDAAAPGAAAAPAGAPDAAPADAAGAPAPDAEEATEPAGAPPDDEEKV